MDDLGLELKFAGGAPVLTETEAGGHVIEGYASLFGLADQLVEHIPWWAAELRSGQRQGRSRPSLAYQAAIRSRICASR